MCKEQYKSRSFKTIYWPESPQVRQLINLIYKQVNKEICSIINSCLSNDFCTRKSVTISISTYMAPTTCTKAIGKLATSRSFRNKTLHFQRSELSFITWKTSPVVYQGCNGEKRVGGTEGQISFQYWPSLDPVVLGNFDPISNLPFLACSFRVPWMKWIICTLFSLGSGWSRALKENWSCWLMSFGGFKMGYCNSPTSLSSFYITIHCILLDQLQRLRVGSTILWWFSFL